MAPHPPHAEKERLTTMAARKQTHIRPPIQKLIGELKSWLPNYNHGPKEYPTVLYRILASAPGGDELADIGYEPFNLGWHEIDQLGRVLVAIQDKRDVEDIVRELMRDEEAEMQELHEAHRIRWNQVQRGNAHVTDGAEGFWADFPPGTSAQAVLDAYLATADYSAATGSFTVTAEIDGNVASVRVGPGGVVGEAHRLQTPHGSWIEMDDRTSYRVEADGRVRVSSSIDVNREDEVAIGASLGHRLGGTWTRSTDWSSASGERDITSIWRKEPHARSAHAPPPSPSRRGRIGPTRRRR